MFVNIAMLAIVTLCAIAVVLDLKRGEKMAAIRDAAVLALVVSLCLCVLMDTQEKAQTRVAEAPVHVDEAPQELIDAPTPIAPPSSLITTQVAGPWDQPANINGLKLLVSAADNRH